MFICFGNVTERLSFLLKQKKSRQWRHTFNAHYINAEQNYVSLYLSSVYYNSQLYSNDYENVQRSVSENIVLINIFIYNYIITIFSLQINILLLFALQGNVLGVKKKSKYVSTCMYINERNKFVIDDF